MSTDPVVPRELAELIAETFEGYAHRYFGDGYSDDTAMAVARTWKAAARDARRIGEAVAQFGEADPPPEPPRGVVRGQGFPPVTRPPHREGSNPTNRK